MPVSLVTYQSKNAPLTISEMDQNWLNLNSGKLDVAGGTVTGALSVQGVTINSNFVIGSSSSTPFTINSSQVSIPNGLKFNGTIVEINSASSIPTRLSGTLSLGQNVTTDSGSSISFFTAGTETGSIIKNPGNTGDFIFTSILNSKVIFRINAQDKHVLTSSSSRFSGKMSVNGPSLTSDELAQLHISKDDASSYINSHIEMRSNTTNPVILGFHRNGNSAAILSHTGTSQGGTTSGLELKNELDVSAPLKAVNTAKAFVKFNGQTGAIYSGGSFNVSSITKHGTGDYTINFTTPMASTAYVGIGMTDWASGGEGYVVQHNNVSNNTSSMSTTSFRIVVGVPGTSLASTISLRDNINIFVVFFGG